jgi:hypothetical protein
MKTTRGNGSVLSFSRAGIELGPNVY